jgi:hypothetical protein
MDISKVILTFGLLIMALGIASFGFTQSVHGDYGVAANKLRHNKYKTGQTYPTQLRMTYPQH